MTLKPKSLNLFAVAFTFISISVGFVNPSHGKHLCTLEVGVDDGRDLTPDSGTPMFANDSTLRFENIPTIPFKKLTMESDVFVAEVYESTQAGDISMSLNIKLDNGDLVGNTIEHVQPNEEKSIFLDLTGAHKIADRLGEQYNDCESEKCHGNLVMLICVPEKK